MIAAVVCALAGLVVGAFLNVLIERIPIKVPAERLPLHLPPSCAWCGESRGGSAWIPIVGALKSCPACHERPQRREVVVEVVTAALFVTMSIRFDDPVVTIAYLYFCAFIVAVSAIDLEHYRIPDRLVFPSLAIAVPGIVLVSLQQDVPEAIPRALLGAATVFGVLLIFHLISPRGMLEVVGAAQRAGVASVAAGVGVRDVDAAARGIITAAGWGAAFTHPTGHSLGLEIHEHPRVASTVDHTLVVGNVVTVEPGVYLPEHGGVRIEDTVLVTSDGCQPLTHAPKLCVI